MSKYKYNNKSNLKFYFLSTLFGAVVTAFCFMALSLVLINNANFNMFVKVMLYVSMFFGGFISGYYLNKKLKGRGYINGLFAGILNSSFLMLIIIALMRFNFSVNILLVLPVVLLGGVVGGIVCANK